MNDNTKIVTIVPIVSGNGAKFVATNLAYYTKLAQAKKKIALLDFNLKQPFLAQLLTVQDEIHGLDNLIDKIDGNMLNESLFLENMVKTKQDIDVLKGTKMLGKHKLFQPTHFQAILDLAKEIYDLILIAVSPDSDNAGTVIGIHEADKIILTARNNSANVTMAPYTVAMVNQYKQTQESLKIIYNMQSTYSADLTEFVKQNGIEVLGALEFDENSVDNINLSGQGGRLFRQKNKNHDTFSTIAKNL